MLTLFIAIILYYLCCYTFDTCLGSNLSDIFDPWCSVIFTHTYQLDDGSG